MGFSKVVAKTDGRVVFVHQLNSDGTPYAEDVTIEAQPGVAAGRVDWTSKDGQIGTISWTFNPYDPAPEGLKFPDA